MSAPDPRLAVPSDGSRGLEITKSHGATVGKLTVRSALPLQGRPTVGAWRFADHMGPIDVTRRSGPDIGPHPQHGAPDRDLADRGGRRCTMATSQPSNCSPPVS
jgi:hypothetical protein